MAGFAALSKSRAAAASERERESKNFQNLTPKI